MELRCGAGASAGGPCRVSVHDIKKSLKWSFQHCEPKNSRIFFGCRSYGELIQALRVLKNVKAGSWHFLSEVVPGCQERRETSFFAASRIKLGHLDGIKIPCAKIGHNFAQEFPAKLQTLFEAALIFDCHGALDLCAAAEWGSYTDWSTSHDNDRWVQATVAVFADRCRRADTQNDLGGGDVAWQEVDQKSAELSRSRLVVFVLVLLVFSILKMGWWQLHIFQVVGWKTLEGISNDTAVSVAFTIKAVECLCKEASWDDEPLLVATIPKSVVVIPLEAFIGVLSKAVRRESTAEVYLRSNCPLRSTITVVHKF